MGRAAFVFPLSFLSNLLKNSQSEKIELKQQVCAFLPFPCQGLELLITEVLHSCDDLVSQVTIWWAGLMRGAVSIALAYNQVKESNFIALNSSSLWLEFLVPVFLFSCHL